MYLLFSTCDFALGDWLDDFKGSSMAFVTGLLNLWHYVVLLLQIASMAWMLLSPMVALDGYQEINFASINFWHVQNSTNLFLNPIYPLL